MNPRTPSDASEAQPLRVFQIDPSWYESYWYGAEPLVPSGLIRPLLPALLLAVLLIAILQAAGHVSAQEHRGVHGKGHGKLHHWYKTLRQPGTGYACCDDKDCRPTTARVRGRTIEVLVDGEWTRVPANTILKRRSPDLNTHVCAPRGPWSPKPIFCVVLGLGV